jgi:hypothetical protein
MSQEDGDATGTTTTTVAPRFLMATIAVDNDATSTWTFDTTLGRYEYASSFNGADWINRGVTWEQKTQRTASASTTCSYFLAKQASGRTFLANDYDYADARSYINRVRYTGFNGDGAPTPDIFPNIQDVFITTITAGQSQEIRNIAEYDGDIIVLKKSSILRLDTSNPDPFTWTLNLIKNGVGTRSSKASYKFDKGLFFTDLYSAYLYDGYQVRDVLKGRWRNLYQSLVTSDAIATSHIVWFNPVKDSICIMIDSVTVGSGKTFYEFNTDTWLPVQNQQPTTTYAINNLVTTSDGVIHFAPTTVGANAFTFSQTFGTPTVNWTFNTGYLDAPVNKRFVPKWIHFLCATPDPFIIYFSNDSGIVNTITFTPTTANKTLFQFSSDIPTKTMLVSGEQAGLTAPSTNKTTIFGIYILGDYMDEFTDVTLLAS